MDVVILGVVDGDEGVIEPTAKVVFIAYGALDESGIEVEPETGTPEGLELETELELVADPIEDEGERELETEEAIGEAEVDDDEVWLVNDFGTGCSGGLQSKSILCRAT